MNGSETICVQLEWTTVLGVRTTKTSMLKLISIEIRGACLFHDASRVNWQKVRRRRLKTTNEWFRISPFQGR